MSNGSIDISNQTGIINVQRTPIGFPMPLGAASSGLLGQGGFEPPEGEPFVVYGRDEEGPRPAFRHQEVAKGRMEEGDTSVVISSGMSKTVYALFRNVEDASSLRQRVVKVSMLTDADERVEEERDAVNLAFIEARLSLSLSLIGSWNQGCRGPSARVVPHSSASSYHSLAFYLIS
ncbi:hypothetical protein FA13DRAFT_1775622 [Coprinellus micaceus]|uniref:Uncharacterized protein n=1 Tax=Coprinellus micaceus TaxID=71717 RepID=A0A4Y7T492_COPMI|nr:hypothetical protein FA13DRAFT_1775622 [Coprinellus micaceus]